MIVPALQKVTSPAAADRPFLVRQDPESHLDEQLLASGCEAALGFVPLSIGACECSRVMTQSALPIFMPVAGRREAKFVASWPR